MMPTTESTKAQAQQIFIFILALFITAGIIIYGYTAVRDFGERQKQVERISLEQQIKGEFDLLLSDFGSIKRPTIRVPSSYEYVCFVDGFQSASGSFPLCTTEPRSPIACNAIQNNLPGNVFFIPDGSLSFIAANNRIVTGNQQKVMCLKNQQGRLKIELESRGDRVIVTEYS